MSDRVWFNVYVTLKDGMLDEFRAMANDWIAYHEKNTPEILAYEWFFTSEDRMKVQVMELYANSEAMLDYMSRGGADRERFMPPYPYTLHRMEVLGAVSDALRERLDSGESKPRYFEHLAGFSR